MQLNSHARHDRKMKERREGKGKQRLDQDMKESSVNIGGGLFRPHPEQLESQQIKRFVIK